MSNPKPFGVDSDLQRRVDQASASWTDASSVTLLHDITRHVTQLNTQIADLSTRLQQLSTDPNTLEPPSKKRKTPQPPIAITTNGSSTEIQAPLLARIKDISFSIPIRKKCTLEIYGTKTHADGGVKVVNTATEAVEATMLFRDIDTITVTPLPDRPTLTYTYCLLPTTSTPLTPPTSIVFSVTSTPPPPSALEIPDKALATSLPSSNFAALLNTLFDTALHPHSKKVTDPDPADFVSAIVQPHRKQDKQWGTRAYQGAKEGWLFPMRSGLLFGFKKPVLWVPVGKVEGVSFTNVLQRTFNMVVAVRVGGGGSGGGGKGGKEGNGEEGTQEVEFAMLDQADFAAVNEWVQKHGLVDGSLAGERKAKVEGVNGRVGTNGGNGEEGEDGDDETELAKAERELQDREDEEEEDFDPGSEGESEGSGSDSEDEDGGGADGAADEDEEVEEVGEEDEE